MGFSVSKELDYSPCSRFIREIIIVVIVHGIAIIIVRAVLPWVGVDRCAAQIAASYTGHIRGHGPDIHTLLP